MCSGVVCVVCRVYMARAVPRFPQVLSEERGREGGRKDAVNDVLWNIGTYVSAGRGGGYREVGRGRGAVSSAAHYHA